LIFYDFRDIYSSKKCQMLKDLSELWIIRFTFPLFTTKGYTVHCLLKKLISWRCGGLCSLGLSGLRSPRPEVFSPKCFRNVHWVGSFH
jgi:hypothetical protein